MAKEKTTLLARNIVNKEIPSREFQKVEWDKGGSWKKDWELVDEPTAPAKASKPKAETPVIDIEEIESLKSEYKSLHPEGKNVPNQKVKDIDWIKSEIAGFKLAVAEAGDEEE